MHEHFCLDGGEPPVSMHFWDDPTADHGIASLPKVRDAHSDQDVTVAGNFVVKRSDTLSDLAIVLGAIGLSLILFSVPRRVVPQFADPLPTHGRRHRYFRPPLRAPPVLTSLLV